MARGLTIAQQRALQVSGRSLTRSVIPDSAVWQISTENYGSTTWPDDVGSRDVAITGDPQIVSLSDGSDGVEGDGTNDYGLFSYPLSSGLANHAIEYKYQSTNGGHINSVVDGNQELQTITSGISNSSGNVYFALRDQDGNRVRVETTGVDVNDGTVHNILVNIIDSTTNDIEIQINGSTASLDVLESGSPDNFKSWSQDAGLWARNNDGSVGKISNLAIAVGRIHDQDISGPTI